MAHPPRIPVWLDWGEPVIWFVTICEIEKRRAWDNATFFAGFRNAVGKLEKRNLWFVRSAVVMPDHLHLLASPMQARDQKVGHLSGALKRWIGSELPESHKPRRSGPGYWDWQPGVFDRLLRKGEFAQQKWEYMRMNPVRAGLVPNWEDWPWTIGIREPRDCLEPDES